MLKHAFQRALYRNPHKFPRCCFKRWKSTKIPNVFYMAVHPDRFGDHPTQQKVNEESLKLLRAYLNGLESNDAVYATTLTFFVKEETSHREVRLRLEGKSASRIIANILKACNLTDGTASPQAPLKSIVQKKLEKETFDQSVWDFSERFYKETPKRTLGVWLKEQSEKVKESQEHGQRVDEHIAETMDLLKRRFGVKGLATESFLFKRSFIKHTLTHLSNMLDTECAETRLLDGRVIKFGDFNGFDQLGKVVFHVHGLPSDWSYAIKTLSAAPHVLDEIKRIEGRLKKKCHGATFTRPRGTTSSCPGILFLKALDEIHSSMNINVDHNDSNTTKYKDILCRFEWRADFIGITREGYVFFPMQRYMQRENIVSFLDRKATAVRAERKRYLENLNVEHNAMSLCKNELQLHSLEKEDSLTTRQTVTACDGLRVCGNRHLMEKWSVVLSKYYSVSADGLVRIPWDFVH